MAQPLVYDNEKWNNATITECRDEINRLVNEINRIMEAHDEDLRVLASALSNEAADRDWCEEFDNWVSDLEHKLSSESFKIISTTIHAVWSGTAEVYAWVTGADGLGRIELSDGAYARIGEDHRSYVRITRIPLQYTCTSAQMSLIYERDDSEKEETVQQVEEFLGRNGLTLESLDRITHDRFTNEAGHQH